MIFPPSSVYLLHSEGDTVIPATETLWLAKDVPKERLRAALVSPAIEHVELKSPTAADGGRSSTSWPGDRRGRGRSVTAPAIG